MFRTSVATLITLLTAQSFTQIQPHVNVNLPQTIQDDLPTFNLGLASRQSIGSDDLKRAAKYDWPGGHSLISPSEKSTPEPVITVHITNDPLPLASSPLVVEGVITSATAHLSGNESTLYSTFVFTPNVLIKNIINAPLANLKLERAGGVAIYPDGHKKLLTTIGFGLPRVNHRYILFLKPTQDGYYRIATGYMIDGDKVLALDQQGTFLNNTTPAQLRLKIGSLR